MPVILSYQEPPTATDEAHLQKAKTQILQGKLVSFPTETVYGLGCDGTNESAVDLVFALKERPLTDPLILHISCVEMGLDLVDHESMFTLLIYHALARSFWPGPLTMVLRKASHVSPKLTAGGKYVGLRMPRHPIALKLLQAVNRPMAGPSANVFGHISPTTAQHVASEFPQAEDLLIFDGGPAEIGIESTVLKICEDSQTLEILRPGQVSAQDIWEVTSIRPSCKFVREDDAKEAPGGFLKHYSPHVPAYLLSALSTRPSSEALSDLSLEKSLVLDFGSLSFLAEKCASYVSAQLDSKSLFAHLRECESQCISQNLSQLLISQDCPRDSPLMDRLLRATSGEKRGVFAETLEVFQLYSCF